MSLQTQLVVEIHGSSFMSYMQYYSMIQFTHLDTNQFLPAKY
jgi:hypothetical protein